MQWYHLILVISIGVAYGDQYPTECIFAWKSGKKTINCAAKDLPDFPTNIEPDTQVLDFSVNNLKELKENQFSLLNLHHLQKLYLAHNLINHIHETAFRGVHNLVHLDLAENNLSEIPTNSWKHTPLLRELRISSNPIGILKNDSFRNLVVLHKLDLSVCQLWTIENGAFNDLQSLRRLRLDGNQLRHVNSDAFLSLHNLHSLLLSDNPWLCDCNVRSVVSLLQEKNLGQDWLCQEPSSLANKKINDISLNELICNGTENKDDNVQSSNKNDDNNSNENIGQANHTV